MWGLVAPCEYQAYLFLVFGAERSLSELETSRTGQSVTVVATAASKLN